MLIVSRDLRDAVCSCKPRATKTVWLLHAAFMASASCVPGQSVPGPVQGHVIKNAWECTACTSKCAFERGGCRIDAPVVSFPEAFGIVETHKCYVLVSQQRCEALPGHG